MINLLIIHYNTPELTEALIKSINKYVKSEYTIYLFDNSTTKPFTTRYNNFAYLDNTKGQYINFNWLLNQFSNKSKGLNDFGSFKHTTSIQRFMDIFDDNFILLDSDILLKKDISELFDDKFIYVGQPIIENWTPVCRVLPFLLYINNKMCKSNNIKFFDKQYMHGLNYDCSSKYYDTGAAFYMYAKDFPHKEIDLTDYIIHYRGGSWEKKRRKKYNYNIPTSEEWLISNKQYYE